MNKRFGFLLFEQFEDFDFVGPWEMIGLWSQNFDGPKELIIINEGGGSVISEKKLVIKTQADFKHCPSLDYLLVPGGQGTRSEVHNTKLISFIKMQSLKCEQILSVCTGAFLLQAAGLLNGKKATTHWASLDRLREFAEIEVLEKRFVKDNNIWTSAGISAGVDMSLAFIAEMAGEKTAGDIQLQAEYYPERKIYSKHSDYLPAYVNQNK